MHFFSSKTLTFTLAVLLRYFVKACENVVEIDSGKVKGTIEESSLGFKYCSFRGISYATPPIGDLRFKVSYMSMMTCAN